MKKSSDTQRGDTQELVTLFGVEGPVSTGKQHGPVTVHSSGRSRLVEDTGTETRYVFRRVTHPNPRVNNLIYPE